MHDLTLIKTIAYGLVFALFLGLLARRMGLQPLVGYLLAGMAIGPYTPGFVGDQHIAQQLAEIGVVLLMFAVGLHFHIKDLVAVRAIAIPGAIGQSLAATICGVLLARWAGWAISSGIVLGIAISVASTVVLLKVLMEKRVLNSPEGHVAVGWLLVEDVVTVIVLVLLPVLALSAGDNLSIAKSVGLIILKFLMLCALVVIAGGRFIPLLLTQVSRLRSQELFTLTVLVLSISVAAFSYFVFGTSMALGAFLAGMVVGQTTASHQAASDILPMRDAFAVLFFVSVGMLFDYRVVLEYPWLTLGVLFVILVVKPLSALIIVLLCGHPLKTGLTVAAALAQIGEFSFIVAELGKQLKIMPAHGQTVLIAAAIVSISLNSYLFKLLVGLEPTLLRCAPLRRWLDKATSRRVSAAAVSINAVDAVSTRPRAVIVGYGIVGRMLAATFERMNVDTVVIEKNIDTVLELQALGKEAVFGDASRRELLASAGLDRASYLVVSVSDMETAVAILEAAKEIAASLPTFVRCHYERDRQHLLNAGAVAAISEEVLVAEAMAESVLGRTKASRYRVRREVRRIQEELGIRFDRV